MAQRVLQGYKGSADVPMCSLAMLGIYAVLAALVSLFTLPVAPVEPAEPAEEDRQQEAEETRRAMELFLREQRVLFRKGELALELDSFYSTDTHEQFLRTEAQGTLAKVTTRTATGI